MGSMQRARTCAVGGRCSDDSDPEITLSGHGVHSIVWYMVHQDCSIACNEHILRPSRSTYTPERIPERSLMADLARYIVSEDGGQSVPYTTVDSYAFRHKNDVESCCGAAVYCLASRRSILLLLMTIYVL